MLRHLPNATLLKFIFQEDLDLAFYKDEKLALFIDGANLYSAARGLQLEIDFRRLMEEFRKKGRLLRANYYTTILETDEHNPIRPLVDLDRLHSVDSVNACTRR